MTGWRPSDDGVLSIFRGSTPAAWPTYVQRQTFAVAGCGACCVVSGSVVFGIRLAKVRGPMVAITHSRSPSSLGTQFNAFLFASIEEGASDAPLSVVSALARLDLDPWQEAAELTGLPSETAGQRLAALLTKLPVSDRAHSDSQTIAQRLIALLPGPRVPESGSSPGVVAGAPVQLALTLIMTLFILMSLIASATSSLTGRASPGTASAAPAAAPAATQSKAPPANLQPRSFGDQFAGGHMSDPNTYRNDKEGASASTPVQLIPPPALDQGRRAPQPIGAPAPGRMPLHRR